MPDRCHVRQATFERNPGLARAIAMAEELGGGLDEMWWECPEQAGLYMLVNTRVTFYSCQKEPSARP